MVEDDDNSRSQNPTHEKPVEDDFVNHSLSIEIHRAVGTPARTRINHVAAITAGDNVHEFDLCCLLTLLQIATYAIINRSRSVVA